MLGPYFFVLGLPKSGTTWVQKALDAHPQLLCRGEGKFMAFRKELSKAAAKYSNHISGYQKKVFGEEFFPPMPWPEFDRLYRGFIEGRLIGEAVPPGVTRIGNKDPEHGPALDQASSERASGGRPRGEADANSFYRRGEVGDWRNHMTPRIVGRAARPRRGRGH